MHQYVLGPDAVFINMAFGVGVNEDFEIRKGGV